MVAPLAALFVGVVGFPLGYAAYLSITDYKLTDRGAPALVGADNYVATFSDGAFWVLSVPPRSMWWWPSDWNW